MDKKIIKKKHKKNYEQWIYNLFRDLKLPLVNFNFPMIYVIHKILRLLKNSLNYFKDSIFECFFKEYNGLLLFFKK